MSLQVDKIFNRIQISRTHIWAFLILCAIQILNSFEIVIISLISPYLKKSWKLGELVQDIPLYLYLGIIVGSLIAGSLSNIVGRKNTLVIGMILQSLSSSCLVLTSQFNYFLVNLFILGMGIGITLVAASTLCTEIFPQKYRGRALLILNFVAIAGKLFAIFFMYVMQSGQFWKTSQIYGFISSFIIIVLLALKIPESPHLLLTKGNLVEAYQILNKIFIEQNKNTLTQAEKQQIKIWVTMNKNKFKTQNIYTEIFRENYLKTTIILSINWFVINFIFYGQLFIMPFIFQRETGGFAHFAQMIAGEIPSILITTNMIEREKLGRKYSLVIFFLIATMLNFTSIYFNSILIIATTRLAMKSIFQILYPLTAQSYPTQLRSIGLAFCSGVGRLGSIVMPMFIYPLYLKQPYYVFVSFMVFCMIGLYSSLAAKETLHQNIDSQENNYGFKQASDESIVFNQRQDMESVKILK